MARTFRHKLIPEARLLIVRFVGTETGAVLLALTRDMYGSHPDSLDYDGIVDMRRWIGMITDHDLTDHIKWLTERRQQRGLTGQPPKGAFLVNTNAMAGIMLQQLHSAHRGNALTTASFDDVCLFLSLSDPTTKSVQGFLDAR